MGWSYFPIGIVCPVISEEPKVSTRTALLEGGVIVEEAPTEIFFTAPKEPRTEEFLRGFGSDHS